MANNKRHFHVDISAAHPEVTGSCILCVVHYVDEYNEKKTTKFAVDCGMFQEEKYKNLNDKFNFNVENLDFMLITHAHLDHIGKLPLAVRKGFNNSIYTTRTTKSLMRPSLRNSYFIHLKEYKNVLYDLEDVEHVLFLTEGCEFGQPIQVTPNIKATFFENGHLLGAALILVQISAEGYDDINLLFTGDYKGTNIFFDVPKLPQTVLEKPLTVIQEATYGSRSVNDIVPCFRDNIIEAVHKSKTIVIPAFSLGRTQEILYILKLMKEEGDIPFTYPIYLDGPLSQEYTRIYLSEGIGVKESMRDFLPEGLAYLNAENRIERTGYVKTKKIIVTSSGMGSHGPAQTHIPNTLMYPKGLVHFTGYMAEGTVGRDLMKSIENKMINVGDKLFKRRGEVLYTNEFSAHAKSEEMIEFLQQFTNLKMVLINHGNLESKETFADKVEKEVKPKDTAILGRDTVYRISPYGLVKSFKNKIE